MLFAARRSVLARLLAALAAPLLIAAAAYTLWTWSGVVPGSSPARYCPHGAVRPRAEVEAAASRIEWAPFTSAKKEEFHKYLASSTLPLDADSLGLLLHAFTLNTDAYVQAVNDLAPYTVGLSCEDAARIIGQLAYSSEQLAAIDALAPLIYDS